MKRPLNEELKNHFEAKELSMEQLKKLNSLQSNPMKRVFRQSISWISAVAVIFVATTIWLQMNSGVTPQEIASEVVYNHNKRLEPEVFGSTIVEFQNHLSRLDFTLHDSVQLSGSAWQVIGGRYCSIDGQLAAQIKLLNRENNREYTLYQVPVKENWDKALLASGEFKEKGVVVKTWIENGLLLALAGP